MAVETNPAPDGARVARGVLLAAGLFGVLALVPQYFLERRYGQDHPPAVTHPEFYYGFIGVALACQVLFLLISTDPRRYRPIILVGVLEKLSFAISAPILYFLHRAPGLMAIMAGVDAIWAVLFVLAYLRTPRAA